MSRPLLTGARREEGAHFVAEREYLISAAHPACTSFTDLQFSADLISFLADDIIIQRYVEMEMEGELRMVIAVVKNARQPARQSAAALRDHRARAGARRNAN